MPPSAGLDPAKIDFQKYYLYGTALNIPPILLMYPFRTVRLLQQRKSSVPVSSSIFTVMKDVQQKNGFRSLYAGATVFSLGLTATKILQFATYDYTLQQVKEHDHFGLQVLKNPSVLSGVIGTFSAVITTFFVVPFDMVRSAYLNRETSVMSQDGTKQVFTCGHGRIREDRVSIWSKGRIRTQCSY
jgi:hypothetical protein